MCYARPGMGPAHWNVRLLQTECPSWLLPNMVLSGPRGILTPKGKEEQGIRLPILQDTLLWWSRWLWSPCLASSGPQCQYIQPLNQVSYMTRVAGQRDTGWGQAHSCHLVDPAGYRVMLSCPHKNLGTQCGVREVVDPVLRRSLKLSVLPETHSVGSP